MLEFLLACLPLTAIINWAVVVVLGRANGFRAFPSALGILFWRSVAIALISTVYCVMLGMQVLGYDFGPFVGSLLLLFPVYLMTAINAFLLWKIWRGTW
jgi:hypothetical protein